MITAKTLSGYHIKNGPDRATLIWAFDRAGGDCSKKLALFEVVENCMSSDGNKSYRAVQVYSTKITGLRYDGDSGHTFVMEGYISVRHLDKSRIDLLDCKFIACYDAASGEGNVNFLVPG